MNYFGHLYLLLWINYSCLFKLQSFCFLKIDLYKLFINIKNNNNNNPLVFGKIFSNSLSVVDSIFQHYQSGYIFYCGKIYILPF